MSYTPLEYLYSERMYQSTILDDDEEMLKCLYNEPYEIFYNQEKDFNITRQDCIISLWGKYKKVYQIDATFFEELINTESIDINNIDLTTLPYSSFYIDFTNIPLQKTSKFPNTQGVFVSVLDNTNVGFVLIRDFFGVNAFEPTNYHLTNGHLDLEKFDETITMNNISKLNSIEVLGDITIANSTVYKQVMYSVVQFLIFLTASNLDIEEDEIQKHIYKERNKDKNKLSSIQKWNVGYRYGKSIRVHKEQKNKDYLGIEIENRNRPRPHTRQAHWHNYWCGTAEDKHLELRWVHPCFVNGNQEDIITTLTGVIAEDYKGSSGEELIKLYLDKLGLDYEREYVVNIKGHARRYDFKVYKDDKIYLIEFDGEQHFKDIDLFGGLEAYKDRRKADFDKNKYAKQNKIPLLRIRYDQKAEIPRLIDLFFEKGNIFRLNMLLSNSDYYNFIT